MERSGFLPSRCPSELHRDGCVHPRASPSPKPRTGSPIPSTSLPWPQPGPGHSSCFCYVGSPSSSFCLPKFPINQSPYPVYTPSAPLGLNYPTQTREMEGGASEWFRTFMGKTVGNEKPLSHSNSEKESSLSPSCVPSTLPHTAHPADVKPQAHWSLPALEDLFIYKGRRPLLFPRLGFIQGAMLHSPPHDHSSSNFQ